MSSREVASAVELLIQKREALESARQRYATAKLARDEEAMSTEALRIDSLLKILPDLELEAAAEVEAAGKVAAEARILGLKKAFGAVVSEYIEDDARVEQCRQQLAEAITKRNARAGRLEGLEKEANALADRFALPLPKLAFPREPFSIQLPNPWQLAPSRPPTEDANDGTARTRRTYAEIKGTQGFDIIMSAGGPKPFRPLTQAEADALEHQAEQRARNELDPLLAAEAAAVAAFPPNLSLRGATIRRG